MTRIEHVDRDDFIKAISSLGILRMSSLLLLSDIAIAGDARSHGCGVFLSTSLELNDTVSFVVALNQRNRSCNQAPCTRNLRYRRMCDRLDAKFLAIPNDAMA